ncbi:MAG: PilZ domain-containing protein [Bdellovibrionota bacterium]
MAIKSKSVYLGTRGQIFGPFSESEFASLERTREIEKYTWIWESQSVGWKPIEAPPPAPPEFQEVRMTKQLEAICMDARAMMSGIVQNITESGCEFIGEKPAGGRVFVPETSVVINLLDPDTGRTVNITARLASIAPTLDGCVYRLRWADRDLNPRAAA